MSKEENNQQQPSQKEQQYDQLIQQLRNPEYVRQLAQQAGINVQTEKREQEPELKQPSPPEITEEMSATQVAKVYLKYTQELQEFNDKKLELALNKQSKSLREESTKSKQQEQANKIRKFASTKPDFTKYIDDIDALYLTGRYTIEEAYEKAKLLAEATKKPVEKEVEHKNDEPTPKKRSSVKNVDINPDDLTPAKVSVKDVAKSRLGELLKERKLALPSGNEDLASVKEAEPKKEE